MTRFKRSWWRLTATASGSRVICCRRHQSALCTVNWPRLDHSWLDHWP